MHKRFTLIGLVLVAGIGIGASVQQFLTPVRIAATSASIPASAIFEVNSTTLGSIPNPKMTTTQRDAISSPTAGLQVFNTSTTFPNWYTGSAWMAPLTAFSSAQVICDTGNGHGSTNTVIRRFTNCTTTGTDITYADSATLGATFTINTAGVYAISYSDLNSVGTSNAGISLNSNQLTTSVSSITTAHRLQVGFVPASNLATVSTSARLAAADVIRAHSNGASDSVAATVQFRIVRIL